LCEPAASARELVLSIGGKVRAADTLHAAAQMLETDPAEMLVIIGPDAPVGEALTFASTLRLIRPAVGVILAREYVDVNLLTQALRAGIREVVQASDGQALAAACQRSYEVSMRLLSTTPSVEVTHARDGQVVTVFAAKGGCGKTTFAINLAVALARHTTDQRVCIVDLDPGVRRCRDQRAA
jgi:pilus assembly protein CpaE